LFPSSTIVSLVDLFRQGHHRVLIVSEKNDKLLLNYISQSDLLMVLAQSLPMQPYDFFFLYLSISFSF
jgi:hypothetical protein